MFLFYRYSQKCHYRVHVLKLIIVLNGNSINDPGLIDLSSSFSRLTEIKELILFLSCKWIEDFGINHLSKSICRLTQITNLALFLNGTKIGPNGLRDLSSIWISNSSKLTNLFLNVCDSRYDLWRDPIAIQAFNSFPKNKEYIFLRNWFEPYFLNDN